MTTMDYLQCPCAGHFSEVQAIGADWVQFRRVQRYKIEFTNAAWWRKGEQSLSCFH
jgi:hypothetical protein